MEHDAWFFIGVFVFIFLVWIATGGPMHPIAFAGPTLSLPGALGGGTYLSLPQATVGGGGTPVSLPGSSGGGSFPNVLGAFQPPTLSGVAFGTPSPYHGIVSMSRYVSGAGSTDPGEEYVQLSVAQNAGVPVDITGWTLESAATGNAAVIPKGTEVPLSGVVNPAQDIVLTPGQQAIIISGRSPIGGSFLDNKCIGYFSDFQSFSPPLPQTCPTPASELSTFYGSTYIRDIACINYVNTIPRCQASLSPPTTVSGACQSFLVTYLNYNGCVAAHQNDADFKGNTWRIYLGRTTPMWRTQYEVVKLLDAQGKTVDAFSY